MKLPAKPIRAYIAAFGLAVVTFAMTPGADAGSLLLAEGPPGDAAFGGYGQSSFNGFTNAVDTVFSGSDLTVVPDLSNLSQVLAADALWIDMRGSFDGTVLSPTELANVAAFIATGRRVAFFGENNAGWGAWNNAFLALVGGASAANTPPGENLTPPAIAHPLTTGLANVQFNSAGIAAGGTPLFGINAATLWGPAMNVLTVLDMNVYFDSVMSSYPQNRQFLDNIAVWLSNSSATRVSEPGTLAVFGLGLASIGLAARRKRKTA